MDTQVLLDRLEDDDPGDEERAEIEEVRNCCEDFEYGAPMIPESEFVDYAQQLAEDCEMVVNSDRWPNYCIDWQYAARELAMDYSLVTYRGTNYYVR